MNLSAEEQIRLAEKLAEIAELVPECGFVMPGPIRFQDKADFNASAGDAALTTQKEIRSSEAAITVITFARPPQKPERHGGYWTYLYNFYLFREYDSERLDETETPDDFRRRVVKSYYDFVAAVIGLHNQFQEERQIPEISGRVRDAVARLEGGEDFIDEFVECRYITGAVGFAVDLSVEVKVLFQEC